MIDFIKLDASSVPHEVFTENDKIDFRLSVGMRDGDIHNTTKGKFYNFDVTLTKRGAYISGSLHKFWNIRNGLGDQNYNDFSYDRLFDAIDLLCAELNIVPKNVRVVNLEFGVNLILTVSPSYIINDRIVSYRRKYSPTQHLSYRGRGNMLKFDSSQYSLKVYDKSKQYGLPNNVLRIEIKTNRAQFTQKLGIYNLQDIQRLKTLCTLKHVFLTHLNDLLILDSFHPDSLPQVWDNLQKTQSKSSYQRRWNEFTNNLETMYQTTISHKIFKLAARKWDSLFKGVDPNYTYLLCKTESGNLKFMKKTLRMLQINLEKPKSTIR